MTGDPTESSKQVAGQPDVVPQKVDVVREHRYPMRHPPIRSSSHPPRANNTSRQQQQYAAAAAGREQQRHEPHNPSRPHKCSQIVGGPEGVTITKGQAQQRPTLSGGIFRQ